MVSRYKYLGLILFLITFSNASYAFGFGGDSICYQSEVDSCHLIVHADELTTPSEYKYDNDGRPQYREPDHFIDLSQQGTNILVSPNFKRSEFMSESKGRYGILAPLLVEKMQNMRDDLGRAIKINSAYRSPAYNSTVGGVNFSRHTYGDAVDFKSAGMTPSELKVLCEQHGASYIQVYVNHVHCDWRNESLPVEFFPEKNSGPSLFKVEAEHSHNHFQDSIKIISEGQLSEGNTIKLNLKTSGAEDSNAELYKAWKIYKNGSLVLESQESEIKLILESATYEVKVEVGGYWSKTKEIVVD